MALADSMRFVFTELVEALHDEKALLDELGDESPQAHAIATVRECVLKTLDSATSAFVTQCGMIEAVEAMRPEEADDED